MEGEAAAEGATPEVDEGMDSEAKAGAEEEAEVLPVAASAVVEASATAEGASSEEEISTVVVWSGPVDCSPNRVQYPLRGRQCKQQLRFRSEGRSTTPKSSMSDDPTLPRHLTRLPPRLLWCWCRLSRSRLCSTRRR